ncbi:heme NO-binding domain-containing protein [Tropicibacter naphthalenivorans]|nr:heme NO-binding domain-containing protein [Tropicibacter naphthalenivorans]
MIFTELLDLADHLAGEEAVDKLLDDLDLDSDAAYTSVGNYPCSELVQIMTALGAQSGVSCDEVQREFGHWVLGIFTDRYPHFVKDKHTAFDLLEVIETEVHAEVRKLYPDAELPTFRTRRLGPDRMEMHYHSERPLRSFCHGLIEACLQRYGVTGQVRIAQDNGASDTVFDIQLER